MKPTKEIIELSKKLHELGYRQDVWDGDWYVVKDRDYISGWSNPKCWHRTERIDEALMDDSSHIPIPSLEDALEWLSRRLKEAHFDMPRLHPDNDGDKWLCWIDGYEHFIADTPHEAVLMAMIKVMEAENENPTS